jgi:hypothetical protein
VSPELSCQINDNATPFGTVDKEKSLQLSQSFIHELNPSKSHKCKNKRFFIINETFPIDCLISPMISSFVIKRNLNSLEDHTGVRAKI